VRRSFGSIENRFSLEFLADFDLEFPNKQLLIIVCYFNSIFQLSPKDLARLSAVRQISWPNSGIPLLSGSHEEATAC